MIGKEVRPLSWAVGDQGIYKIERPSLRDLNNDRRMAEKELKSPDQI
jgi:NADH-quinone oxidoreductase subunit B